MPYVDIQSESNDDYTSIWYTTNSRFGNVGGFDASKPTVAILHPTFLDSQWVEAQFVDPRLDSEYNLIAFDMRASGRTNSRPSAFHDSWVDAADLALAFHALHLPPAHILALENLATNAALRFAALFPELCQSLTLCNASPPTELSWVFNAYEEILQSWGSCNDLDSFEHSAKELCSFIIGRGCDEDLQDEVIAYWELMLPPYRRERLVELLNVIMNRSPLGANVLAAIKAPVLLIHGEFTETSPLKYIEQMQRDLCNADNGRGAVLYTVKGAGGCLNIVQASIMNQTFSKFLARTERTRSDLFPPAIPTHERFQGALRTLGRFVGNSSICNRDCTSPLSFSCLAPDVIKSQAQSLEFFRKGRFHAFSPLGVTNKAIRKYSERKLDHWFASGPDNLSHATGAAFSKGVQPTPTFRVDAGLPIPKSEPVSVEAAQDSRLRRTTYTHTSVDKQVIKGMAKVVSSPAQRILH